ncbi:MAG: hypothetical protein JRJ59_02390, partial [Deltaproteobacteria bacterium]|nr:hypothetical protein [Deltaproteobacteria bacterium]
MLIDIMASHLPAGRVLSEVLVDGQTYNEETPRAAAGLAREAIERLDLITIPSASLADAMLDSGPGHLETLVEAAAKLADEFRLSDEAEANEKYLIFLQAMQDFFSFLGQALDALAISLAHLEVKGLSASAKLKDLTSV